MISHTLEDLEERQFFDSKSLNIAAYFFLNNTWSASSNLKPHGILLNKQCKNLPMSLLTALWLDWSFFTLLDLGPPQTEFPDLTPSAEI